MRFLHINIYRLLGALCVALAVSTASCSEDKGDPRGTLLSQVGPDFDLLIVTNPTELARSAGEEAVKKLHATDSELFMLIASAEGVDKEAAVAVAYSNPVQSAVMLPVTNSGKLSRSLEEGGWKKEPSADGAVYGTPGSTNKIYIGDKVMWLVRTGATTTASEAVAALTARAGELPGWLTMRLGDVAERPVAFCYTLPDSTRYFGSVTIDGPAAEARVVRIDTDGLRLTFVGSNRRQAPGSVLEAVNPDAMIALSATLPTDFNTEGFIENMTGGVYLTDDMRQAIAALDGRFGLSVSMADPTSANPGDFGNYRVAVGLGTAEGKAKEALAALTSVARSAGMPVSGQSISLGGEEIVKGQAYDDLVLLTTPGAVAATKATSAEGCLVWLRVKLPAGLPMLGMLGVRSGLDIKADVTPEEANIKMDFPGSDRGFIANIIDIADAF